MALPSWSRFAANGRASLPDSWLEKQSLVLDAGAGNGEVAIYMSKKGLRKKPIDLVDMHVQWAKVNVERNDLQGQIEGSNGNFENLEFDNDTFDGAYTMETLVHSGEPTQAMREFYRVLKPGGVVTRVGKRTRHGQQCSWKEGHKPC